MNKPAKAILNTPYPQSDHDPESEPNLGLIIGDHEITFPWQLKNIYEQFTSAVYFNIPKQYAIIAG